MDSTACLDFYLSSKHESKALIIDYGQVAFENELKAIRKISKHYSIPYQVLTIKSKTKFKSGFIQGRNLFLLSAALMQMSNQPSILGIGIHDGTNYKDCNNGFLASVQKVFDIYTDGLIQIGAPFLHWSKADIWKYIQTKGVPWKLTYSCELGLKQPCGKCASCKDLIKLYASETI